ncbi:hypothetical protein Tco_0268767 [Tanacetum coccineum]
MAFFSKTFKNLYKPTNNNLRSSSNIRYKNVDNSPRVDELTGNDRQTGTNDNPNQMAVIVSGNRDTVDMDQDSAHMVAASKVPMLKPGKYEIWRMRIEKYIQMIDYALWEGVMTEMLITSAEDKA